MFGQDNILIEVTGQLPLPPFRVKMGSNNLGCGAYFKFKFLFWKQTLQQTKTQRPPSPLYMSRFIRQKSETVITARFDGIIIIAIYTGFPCLPLGVCFSGYNMTSWWQTHMFVKDESPRFLVILIAISANCFHWKIAIILEEGGKNTLKLIARNMVLQ